MPIQLRNLMRMLPGSGQHYRPLLDNAERDLGGVHARDAEIFNRQAAVLESAARGVVAHLEESNGNTDTVRRTCEKLEKNWAEAKKENFQIANDNTKEIIGDLLAALSHLLEEAKKASAKPASAADLHLQVKSLQDAMSSLLMAARQLEAHVAAKSPGKAGNDFTRQSALVVRARKATECLLGIRTHAQGRNRKQGTVGPSLLSLRKDFTARLKHLPDVAYEPPSLVQAAGEDEEKAPLQIADFDKLA